MKEGELDVYCPRSFLDVYAVRHCPGEEQGIGAALIHCVRRQVQYGLDMDVNEPINAVSNVDDEEHEPDNAPAASSMDADADIERTYSRIFLTDGVVYLPPSALRR
ncbi:uncharacterized protein BXZ73DRAFT_108297 [Epithele typhae]|uniref:uncharacterized protein n=1 Tax=Epithele typhae TaxID=378194 RepID=UPI0020085ED7|nr:uncharacterized protein BXZ73DRAFT_108297 [Epithele typhae]KAH9911015.1 hypothetical protein BXZ73DRAFT_108297 [Epithele typhae]